MSGRRAAVSSDESTVESDAMLSRRSVLGITGVAVITGVTGCTAKAGRQPAPTSVVDATARVKSGQYEAFEFELAESKWTTVSAYLSDRSVEVKEDGPGVDVVVMTATQYDQFQNQGTFEYVGGVSMPDVVNGEVSDTLKSGKYVALVDNTSAGTAKPDDSEVTAVVRLGISTSDSQSISSQ